MLSIYQQLQERNARETTPFVAVHESNAALLNQVDALQFKCEGLEREISTLEHQLATSGSITGTSSGPAAASAALKNEARLRDKLEKLQEELNTKLKVHAADQATALKTANDLATQKDLNQAQESTIQSLQKELTRKDKEIEKLHKEVDSANDLTKLIEKQFDGLKDTIRSLQKENDKLTKENNTIEARLVADKTNMVDEMNILTEMVDSLKREVDMLRSLEKHEEKRKTSSWFGMARLSSKDSATTDNKEKDDNESTRKFGMLGTILPSGPKETIAAHTAEAISVRYDSMGADLVATAGADSMVKVWDTSTGTLRATLRGPSGHTILGCDMCGSLVAGAASDKTCRVWNFRTERMIHHLVGHNQKVTCVRLFDNGRYAMTGSADRSMKVWDIGRTTYKQTVTMRHGSTTNCLDVGSNGVDVVTGHHDGGLRFWDTRSGDRTMDIKGIHENSVTSVQFNPVESTQILTNGLDSCVNLVDARTGSVVYSLNHAQFSTAQSWASSVFSPNGAYAAAGSSMNGNIFVWDLKDGSLKKILEGGHTAGVAGIAWGRGGNSGQQVASVDRKGSLVLWA